MKRKLDADMSVFEEASYDDDLKENKNKTEVKYEDDGLSEYEKMVQRNREESLAFLQSLKIEQCKDEFKEAITNLMPVKRKPQTSKSCKRAKVADLAPVRKSRRLAKLDVNLSEDALFQKAVQLAEAEEKKKVIPIRYAFEEAIQDKEDLPSFADTFSINKTTDTELNNDYISSFNQMKLKESNIAKVVPVRITALAVHPTTDKVIVFAGSKYGNLGFWNVTSDMIPVVFNPHKEGITHVKVNPDNHLQIISSSYDGTMRCGDIEKKVFTEIYNVSEETCCTYFDFLSSNTFLVSQRNGNVSVVDIRNESLRSQKTNHHCHDYSVKTVSVHPVNKNIFLTADPKGVMKLWDLRKLQKKPIISVTHHRRSISSAFFSPATGKSILTTSLDDTLCVFDSSEAEKEVIFDRTIKHNNQTGRWLSPFKAAWLPNSDDCFVVGSMQYPRRIEIYSSAGRNIYNFTDDNLASITSLNQFHPSLNVLAGANSSGKVLVFVDKTLKF